MWGGACWCSSLGRGGARPRPQHPPARVATRSSQPGQQGPEGGKGGWRPKAKRGRPAPSHPTFRPRTPSTAHLYVRVRVHRDGRRSTSRHPLPWPPGEPCPPPVPTGHGAQTRAWGFSPAPPAGRPRPLTSLSLRGCGSDPRLSHRSPCPVLPFLPALGRLLSAGRPPPWTVARPLGISTRPSEALPAGLCQPATGRCRCGCRTLLGLLREGLWDTDLGGQGHAPGVNIGHSGLSC